MAGNLALVFEHLTVELVDQQVNGGVKIGVDGVGKAAVSSAIVRSRRWKNVKRVVFTGPVSVADVDAIFQDAPEGQLRAL